MRLKLLKLDPKQTAWIGEKLWIHSISKPKQPFLRVAPSNLDPVEWSFKSFESKQVQERHFLKEAKLKN